MKAEHPGFNGYEIPANDFERARTQIATPFSYIDIALDTATSNQIVTISGDFLYCDAASTGQATIELNNQYSDKEAPFYVQSGFALQASFRQLRMSWTSQPGKILRLLYSTGDRVVPANAGVTNATINNAIGAPGYITDSGFNYGASYKSTTVLTLNTPETIFTPGANINGAILWNAEFFCRGSALILPSILAKISAPINSIDGDVFVTSTFYLEATGPAISASGKLSRPVKISAGKGLYYIESSAAATGAIRHAEYTLL